MAWAECTLRSVTWPIRIRTTVRIRVPSMPIRRHQRVFTRPAQIILGMPVRVVPRLLPPLRHLISRRITGHRSTSPTTLYDNRCKTVHRLIAYRYYLFYVFLHVLGCAGIAVSISIFLFPLLVPSVRHFPLTSVNPSLSLFLL